MPYIKLPNKGKIHIASVNGRPRCQQKNDRTDWVLVEATNDDAGNICQICLSTPADPARYYAARREHFNNERTSKLPFSRLYTCRRCGAECKWQKDSYGYSDLLDAETDKEHVCAGVTS